MKTSNSNWKRKAKSLDISVQRTAISNNTGIKRSDKCEIGNINIQHTDPIEINTDIHLPLKDDKLAKLQESDPHTRQLRKQWENKNLDQNTYTMENNILKRKLVNNRLLYTPIMVPDVLRDCLLILAHEKQGHNRFRRTYASLKNRYHWNGHERNQYTNIAQIAKFAQNTTLKPNS